MKEPVVIIGMGEMGGVFARGFLRIGHPVYPVTRVMDIHQMAANLPEPGLVLLAVGEKDLHNVLAVMPEAWKEQLVLLQNELLPRDWEQYGLKPTVISVWFEKKKGQDYKVLVPSPVFGNLANLVAEALKILEIPTDVLESRQQLLFELVRKNLYIVTTNVAGLRTGGTVADLRDNHAGLMRDVLGEVLQIQQSLTGETFDADALNDAVLAAFDGDPEHNCMGRSAPARLQRALTQAKDAGIDVPTLQAINNETGAAG